MSDVDTFFLPKLLQFTYIIDYQNFWTVDLYLLYRRNSETDRLNQVSRKQKIMFKILIKCLTIQS